MEDYTSHTIIGVDWGGLNVNLSQSIIIYLHVNWGRLGWINHSDITFKFFLKERMDKE